MGLSIAWWRLARAQKAPESQQFQVFRRDDNDRKIYCNTLSQRAINNRIVCRFCGDIHTSEFLRIGFRTALYS